MNNTYYNPYYNPYYGNQQPYYNQQPPKPRYTPLYFTNGIVGVQSLILDPNEKVYLLDSDNNALYIKSADQEGRYSIESFELSKTGSPKTEYVLQEDFKAFTKKFEDTMEQILKELKHE